MVRRPNPAETVAACYLAGGTKPRPREEVMAIGDNYNDIEMLAFAGYPFIMGNASEELRGRGWNITLANDQNGVAAAIEQVLDGNPVAGTL